MFNNNNTQIAALFLTLLVFGHGFLVAQEEMDVPLPEGALVAANPVDPLVSDQGAVPSDIPLMGQDMPGTGTPTENVVINLINRLVDRGVLTKDDAAGLIQQAEADAVTARQQVAEVKAAAEQVAMAAAAEQELAASGDSIRVNYVPEHVRAQIRDEIKDEVLAQAKEENWAAPNAFPNWASRLRFFGDVRLRYEGVNFPEGNDNTGGFPNFNAINTGSPYDVSGFQFAPQYNVDQDRDRFRLRARLGLEADLDYGFTAGFRIATGENSSPVSTNQSLGVNGGNFSKYALWLDRAFLKYQWGGLPEKGLTLMVGRFDNPFFSTEILWDDDLGFDGAALQAHYEVFDGVTPFLTGGAFPVYNTDFNFATYQPAKFESEDKYLYGVQFGTDWRIRKEINLKAAAAYYYFDSVEGRLSDPFVPLSSQDAGSTDATRPSFAQKGNTYMALRNIPAVALNNFGTSHQYQYYGLATPFEELALTGRLDFDFFEPIQISLVGEWVRNLAFDQEAIEAVAVNNRGVDGLDSIGKFEGGDTAWIAGLKFGHPKFQKPWDWSAGASYRYVESDAVVDGFADSDFGLGGTNMKGFSLYGVLAFTPNINVGVRWMSATEIAGPPLKTDVIQLDINGKF